jgi:phosphatidate cytidylyltransferase
MLLGGPILALCLGAASYMAGEEFIAMTRAKGIHPSPRIIRSMIIAYFVVAALPEIPGLNLPPHFSEDNFPLLLTIGVCTSFFRLLFRHENPPATIADIATTVLGFIYIGWMPSHLVLMRNLSLPGEHISNPLQQPGLAYVMATTFIIFGTDVFAYYGGKKWGKRLLYPLVSPKKTVEGAIVGFFAGIGWAIFIFYLSDNFMFPSHPFHNKLWMAVLMGAVGSVGAQLGDLSESLLKRDAGMKDSSQIIPGHGGILDRGDSLIFASAICYYWVKLFVLGMF